MLFPPPPTVFIPKKGGSMAQPPKQHRHRTEHPWEPKRSHEIPLEAVKEYVEIMEDLLGTAHSATVEPDGKYEEEEENEQQQEEDELYPDPGLLSYIDKLCAQEALITKVGQDLRFGVCGLCTFGVPATKHLEFYPRHCN
nr:NUT family member 1-like [Loxodonta africana]